MKLTFTIPGEPSGKGRPRVGRVGQHVRMFTPAKTLAYEGLIAHIAAQQMAGRAPFDEPCRVALQIVCSVPASWSGRKRAAALRGELVPAKKPDVDNVLKAVCDGMNGVVFRDDVQVVDGAWRKRYGETPGVTVTVEAYVAGDVREAQMELPTALEAAAA